MPRLGCLTVAIAGIVLVVVGWLFLPVAKPHAELAANYHEPFFHLGPFPITNTILASWIAVALLLALFLLGSRRMKLVPRGLQNLVELIFETMANFVEGVAGERHGRRFLPVVLTIFLYVLFNAWLSLFPGFATIGFGAQGEHGGFLFPTSQAFVVHTPILRAANTDINLPLMLALMSFVFVEFWGLSSLGVTGYLSKFFRVQRTGQALKDLLRGRIKSAFSGLLYGAIDLFVGGLELLSEFIRIISFTFRLFGNMTAGEVLIFMIAFLIPLVAGVAFYGLEIMLGFIQALIFGGLTLVFATHAVAPHGGEHEH